MSSQQIRPFHLDLDDAEIRHLQAELGDILRGGTLILGPRTEAFERAFADRTGTRHAIALNSGTSALEILMFAQRLGGRKVAVATNTNFATVAAIVRNGGVPVYMDMTVATYSPDLAIVQATLERHPDLGGVVWVHIGGLIAPDFPDVVAFCRSRGLFLVEDAAHAHGSRLGGRAAGAFADGAAFSFFPTKVMTTFEGGMITTDSDDLAALARSMRNQGKRGQAYGGLHSDLGSSWRINELGAAMGLVMLAKLDGMIDRRSAAAAIVMEGLDAAGIAYCRPQHMDRFSTYKLIVPVPPPLDAADVRAGLARDGILCGGGVYDVPCHRQPVFADIAFAPEEVAVSDAWCPRHVCPPITSATTPQEAGRIAAGLVQHLRGSSS